MSIEVPASAVHTTAIDRAVMHRLVRGDEPLSFVHSGFIPGEPSEPFDAEAAAMLHLAPALVRKALPRIETLVALSDQAVDELHQLGAAVVHRARLADNTELLLNTPAFEPTVHHFATFSGPLLVSVGDIVPHRRIERVVQSYNALATFLDPSAVLAINGEAAPPAYASALTHLINESNLVRAGMYGTVAPGELVAQLQAATAAVCLSEYEHVAPRLTELLAFGVPVIYRRGTGAERIVGDGGIALPQDAGPLLVAEAFAELAANDALRERLSVNGRRRVALLQKAPVLLTERASESLVHEDGGAVA